MDLTEFLTARLCEEELLANDLVDFLVDGGYHGMDFYALPGLPRRFLLTHAPGRVLREVEAKRARLAAYIAARTAAAKAADPYMAGVADGLGIAVGNDAAVWSGHPDYRDEWNP